MTTNEKYFLFIVKSMWYRLSRRENDFCIECSEDSSFKATFTNMEITECKWLAHDGQQPDAEFEFLFPYR